MIGPPGAGKTAALECLHRITPAGQRGPLIQFSGRSGRTLLYDHAEFEFGTVGSLPLYVDVYALPGSPLTLLARRIILSGCDGFLFTADARDVNLGTNLESFQDLLDYLSERGRFFDDTALVVQLTHLDLLREGESGELMNNSFVDNVGDRLLHVSTLTGEGILDAVKKCTALALALEREELEARMYHDPPVLSPVPPEIEDEVAEAHGLYLRAYSATGTQFSPHGDAFLAWLLRELELVDQGDLNEAERLCSEARKLSLGVDLEQILTQRQMVGPADLLRAKRLRCSIEVIHEENLFARLASEMEIVPFRRVKQAMNLQARRAFHHSLDHLLMRAGHLDRIGRRQILIKQLQAHQGELLREARPSTGRVVATATDTSPVKVPLFGEVALNLGLVTREQLDACLAEQRKLREEQGKRRFLGAIMRGHGFLGEDEIRRVCQALEGKMAEDRIDGYRIMQHLGRGNMALVFAAVQLNLDRVVALKILDPKLLFDADFIERFTSEARAAARLNHPNIVQAYDVGSTDDLHYFAMEYVHGITAKKLLEDCDGRMDEDTAIDVVLPVARALNHAAKHKLVHRDVKPGNVMITADGGIKLCDLGLAKTLDAEAPGEDGVILGSPYYISPEQIRGDKDIDIRADIYSLGAMLFHLITGRPPFMGRTPEDVCLQHLHDPVPNPRDLAGVSRDMPELISRMMAKDRRDRFASCDEVVRALVRMKPHASNDDRRAVLSERVSKLVPLREFPR
ncbi:MAG: protein kinase [Planctomycetes bacterium]|nr:protein kinase [Planctomycetota bacterium]